MSERLERRHRRLLAIFYPAAHRREYEGEMLAVLLAGARPGQRWPSVHDAANLAGYGLRARLSAAGTGAVSPAWADAVAVTALLGALALLSQRVLRVLQYVVLPGPALPLSTVARAVAWAAVVVAILAGWRRVAAACAWLTVAAEAAMAALLAVATLPRPVRHRVLALAVPLAVLGGGLTVYWNGDLGGLTAFYWLVVAGVPVVALVFRAAAARGRRNTEDASGV